ncbi:MAG: LytTR family DNA-binding domain-containing protein [Lacibacter sp.]
MIKVLTVDDEPKNLRILKELISGYCPQATLVGEADSIDTAILLIREHQPDLVLLDIEMPNGNAFDLLDRIMPVNFEIVFVTAFDAFTLKAFKYSALDYLLKPVSIEELKTAIAKAQQRIDQKNLNLRLNNLLQGIQNTDNNLQKIAIPAHNGNFEFIAFDEILYCEASGPFTFVHTSKGYKLTSSKSIKEYEELLPQQIFFRSHHSYLINLNKVKRYLKGRGGEVEMSNGSLLEVATRRKEEFLKRIGM